jgi:hypothetical protein
MIRIDDDGDVENFADRFERAIELTGAPQRVRLSLDEVFRGNGGRPLNPRRMRRVLFYFQRLDARATLLLDNVRLTR